MRRLVTAINIVLLIRFENLVIRQLLTFVAMKQNNVFEIFEFFLKQVILLATDD